MSTALLQPRAGATPAQAILDLFRAEESDASGRYMAECPSCGKPDKLTIKFVESGERYRALISCWKPECPSFRGLLELVPGAEDLNYDNVVDLEGVTITPAEGKPLTQETRESADALSNQAGFRLGLTDADHPAREFIREKWGADLDPTEYDLGLWNHLGERIRITGRTFEGEFAYAQGRAIDPDDDIRWAGDKSPANGERYDVAAFFGPHRDGDVVVTEGVSDALMAASLGYVTVGIRGAKNAARISDVADHLKGRTVIVCGDNDADGEEFAQTVGQALQGVAGTLKRVRFAPGDDDLCGLGREGAEKALKAATKFKARKPRVKKSSDDDDKEKFGSAALVEFVLERFDLGRSSDGKLVAVPKTGPRVAKNLASMKGGIQALLFREKRLTPSQNTMATAFSVLEGIASESGDIDVRLRAASDARSRTIHVDLANDQGDVIRVTRDGWEVADQGSTPAFRRTSASRPLPFPVRGDGAKAKFAALLGLDESSREWRLIWGWLVAAFFDDVPRPMLWTTGEQGSGKTSRSRFILNLVDPADALGGNPGRNERDDTTGAAGRYVATYDNLRNISESTSDWVCRLVTGVTVDRRALYTDDGVHTSVLRRTGLATSISLPLGLGQDAIERLVVVKFPRIPEGKRRTEQSLCVEYERMHAAVFAALLDDVAGVLRHSDEVDVDRLPRMADYATVLHALDVYTGGEFAAAYLEATESAMKDKIEDDPILSLLPGIIYDAPDGRWRGQASALTAALRARAPEDVKVPSPMGIKRVLENNATALREVGVTWRDSTVKGRRLITLEMRADDDENDEWLAREYEMNDLWLEYEHEMSELRLSDAGLPRTVGFLMPGGAG